MTAVDPATLLPAGLTPGVHWKERCWADPWPKSGQCMERGNWDESIGLCPKHYKEIVG